jgi:DNA-binding transcriptional ArsR family regulator
VASSILEHGPSTAAELAEQLGLTPAAIRRHLDVLLAAGHVEAREQRVYGARGRGRPAKDFVLTDAGRSVFYTAYDGIAIEALEFLAASEGSDAVTRFAEGRMARGEKRYRDRMAHAAPKTAMSHPHCRQPSVSSSASIIARWRMSPSAFRRSARSRQLRSHASSVSTYSGLPLSRTAMVCARLMFPISAAPRPI